MRRLSLFITLNMMLWFSQALFAQLEGKEFWYTLGTRRERFRLCNQDTIYYNNDSLFVYILGDNACAGYIENPATAFHEDFTVQPGVLTTIKVPDTEIADSAFNMPSPALLQGRTIMIRTTENVQAWAQIPNYGQGICNEGSAEKTRLYPVESAIVSYVNPGIVNLGGDIGALWVIALEDGTYVYSNEDTVPMNRGDALWIDGNIHTNCKRILAYQRINNYAVERMDLQTHSGLDFLLRNPQNPALHFSILHYNNVNISASFFPDIPLQYVGQNFVITGPGSWTDTWNDTPYAFARLPIPYTVAYYLELRMPYSYYPISPFTQGNGFQVWRSTYTHMSQLFRPVEVMTQKWSLPITKNTFQLPTDILDTTYVDITIFTHADGIHSTYFNNELIPASAFDTFPATNGEYYTAQLAWWSSDSLPDHITIENPNGFYANVLEMGYAYRYSGYPTVGNLLFPVYCMLNSSTDDMQSWPYAHSNLSLNDSATVYRCVGDTLLLQVAHNPDSVPVEWIFEGDSYPFSELSFLLPSVDTLTVQMVLHYDNCPDTTTTFIVVVPPPIFESCHDDTLCHGAQLSVQQPNVLSYLWSDGAHTPAITVDSAGIYSVTVTNLGCKAESDLFTIDLYPQSSVEFGNDSTLCELATLLLDATQPHPALYVWQDQSTNATYTVYEDGQYWVVVTDHCLGASDTIAIGYLADFTVDLGPDTTICEGRTLLLSAENPWCDYEWQDGSTQPTYLVRHPGTYSVTASNQCFEHGDDIVVEYEPCDQELWLPNSFTPDGDGLNDLFLPVFAYPDEVESFEMTIYDRWGMVMFDTKSKEQGWNAAGVPDGVYVVFVRYKSRGHETRDVTGSVTVVR